MTIGAIYMKKAVAVTTEVNVSAVIKAMEENNLGSIIIVKEEKPVGIITDRDILLRVIAKGLDPLTTKVEQVMTRNPITFTADTEPADALETVKIGARRFPVVDEAGKLIGIVSIDDITARMARVMAALARIVGTEKPRV